MRKVRRKVGRYEVGRTIGEGTFAKVKFARNTETGESVAIKVLAKSTVLRHQMVEQVQRGRLSENESRQYFQQLIDAVAHCHDKGVYHRDLKPENLLLDAYGKLKVSDFGLSALAKQGVDLLHTTCGTPNYVAPEVLSNLGYDGAAADVWSCGVILYVLMAGYLPFEEADLPALYKKINAAEFTCPFWISVGAKTLIHKILDPNPKTRIRIEEIRKDPWFRRNYVPAELRENEEVNLDDVQAVFDDMEHHFVAERQSENTEGGPLVMNAFEMITLSQGLNLSALFDRRQDFVKRQTRFVSRKPAKVIISSIEAVAESMGLKVHSRNYKVFEVAPSLFMVDVRKAAGDTLDYHKVSFTRIFVPNWKILFGEPQSQRQILACLDKRLADPVLVDVMQIEIERAIKAAPCFVAIILHCKIRGTHSLKSVWPHVKAKGFETSIYACKEEGSAMVPWKTTREGTLLFDRPEQPDNESTRRLSCLALERTAIPESEIAHFDTSRSLSRRQSSAIAAKLASVILLQPSRFSSSKVPPCSLDKAEMMLSVKFQQPVRFTLTSPASQFSNSGRSPASVIP
ncbi:CBL-interacting serine/threonine-protein kinase 24 isoform X1 [Senna tora]|uniref:non-specific serine/threonine protein kinase n=1 Tax=Senna tora TaxID=362788 RepID=A0A834W5B1_9FABA|nr:CBL-interacting serine/threonine-protein kinase 24 isoform X1 [Senna tora]